MKDRGTFISRWRMLLVPALLLPPACLVWVIFASGILTEFRPEPSTDPWHLRGTTLPLTGDDPFMPGARFDLAALRGKPVLVCRMTIRNGHWIVAALKHLAEAGDRFQAVAVSTAQDEDPPTWVRHDGWVPFTGVRVDDATRDAWHFGADTAVVYLIGADGVIATGNLVRSGRDDTMGAIHEALEAGK